MQFSALKEKATALWEQLNNLKALGPRAMKRAAVHFCVGGIAIAAAIASASPVFAGGLSAANGDSKNENVSADAEVTYTEQPAKVQTVYATQTWWKASIEEYGLATYTAKEVSQLEWGDMQNGADGEQSSDNNIKYPDISFTVTAADGSSAAQPVVYPHADCGTRDISKEYYTVKSVSSGAIVSDNAFDLVCRVLNAEMGSGYPMEALKAQAVAIYSYIRYCDANGMLPVVAVSSSYGSTIEQAVRSVEGQVCAYGGVPINALFCASTAGNSQGSEYVWGRALPYMKPIVSKYDAIDSNYGVKTTFTASELKEIIEDKTDIVLDPQDVEHWFEITGRSYGKYVTDIKIAGQTHCKVQGSTARLTAAVLRTSIIGNNKLRSTAFDVSYNNGVFTFTTYGYGHGVGMSQRGAQLLALKDGLKYDQILRYYYTGVKVVCSSPNKAAEDRYGSLGDISGLEEAFPSDGCLPDADDDLTDSESGENQDTAGDGTEADESAVTTPQETSQPDASETPEAPEQSSPTVTTAPEVSAPSEPDKTGVGVSAADLE